MKMKAIVLGVLLSVGLFQSPVVSAIPVTCTNCSSSWIQAMELAQKVDAYLKQVQEYTTQLNQWRLEIEMGLPLSGMQFDNALTMIRTIESIMQSGTQITYNVNNLQERFANDYPSTSVTFSRINQMGSQSRDPTSMWNAFFRDERNIRQNQDMQLQAMQSLKAQSNDLARDQSMIAVTNAQLSSSRGHQQSMQATAVYAQHSVQQLMKLRQGLTLLTQLAVQEQADRSRREATERATIQKWVSQRPGRAARTPRTATDRKSVV